MAEAVTRTTLVFPTSLVEQWERAARELGRTKTEIVTEALRQWLDEHERREQQRKA